MTQRLVASQLLRGAESAAREYGGPELARSYATTALWLDLRNWSSALLAGDPTNLARFGQAVAINTLLMTRFEVESDAAAERMDDWLENEVVAALKEDEPEIFDWLIESLRTIILDRGGGSDDAP